MTTDQLRSRAKALGFYGLFQSWNEIRNEPWLVSLIEREERVRAERSLERRIQRSRIGSFKPLADYDFDFPRVIDREQIEDLFTFDWLDSAANVILVGGNGVGKTMIAQNLAHQALLCGATVRLLTASELLNDLAAQDSASALQRRIAHYVRPRLLAIDELGYLSYDTRHADLLFEVVSRRYGRKPILITTNKAFAEWNEVFPSATCVVTLVDRLVHHAEIVKIEGDSYRLREAKEAAEKKARARAERRKAKKEAAKRTEE